MFQSPFRMPKFPDARKLSGGDPDKWCRHCMIMSFNWRQRLMLFLGGKVLVQQIIVQKGPNMAERSKIYVLAAGNSWTPEALLAADKLPPNWKITDTETY